MGSRPNSLDHRCMAALSTDQSRHCADGKRKGISLQVCFWDRLDAHIFWKDDIRPSLPSGYPGKNASFEYDFSNHLCLCPSGRDYLYGSAYDRVVPEKPGYPLPAFSQ